MMSSDSDPYLAIFIAHVLSFSINEACLFFLYFLMVVRRDLITTVIGYIFYCLQLPSSVRCCIDFISVLVMLFTYFS